MQHRAATEFWQEYQKLPLDIRRRADNQFFHCSSPFRSIAPCKFKKIGDGPGHEVWSARVTLTYRALANKRDYGFLWFWIGDHETYETLIT